MQCKHVKENGSQCKANSMTNSDFCYLHNPNISEEEKKQGQARGGQMRVIKTKKPLSKMRLKKPKHIVLLLADIINRVRFGEIDVKSANCIGALSGHMIRAMALVGIPPEPPEPVSYAEIIERWEKIFGVKLNHVDPEGERQLRVNNDRP